MKKETSTQGAAFNDEELQVYHKMKQVWYEQFKAEIGKELKEEVKNEIKTEILEEIRNKGLRIGDRWLIN